MKNEWARILTPQRNAEVDKYADSIQEIRLRTDQPGQLVTGGGEVWLKEKVTEEELRFVLNTACRYSPWASDSLAQGYLTAPGGHRIGVCGEAVTEGGQVRGIRNISSVNIRIARDIPGIGAGIPLSGNILILGPPGSGKTTLLREVIRRISRVRQIAVVDERQELFPPGFERGPRTDVLSLWPREAGLDMALRTLGPEVIAMDEITAEADCYALQYAMNCGVCIVATAHGTSKEDFYIRPAYQPLAKADCFDRFVIMSRDKSWRLEEREEPCLKSLAHC